MNPLPASVSRPMPRLFAAESADRSRSPQTGQRGWPSTRSELTSVVEDYADLLVWHAFRLLGNMPDAEDVVQDVFARVFTSDRREEVASVGAYLYRTVANACTDHLRRGRGSAHRCEPIDLDRLASSAEGPPEAAQAVEESGRIEALLARPLYANSFDGRSVHLLELGTLGRPRILDEPVAREFQPPTSPADFLGILAYVKTSTDDPGRRHMVRDEGPTKLPDGTPAHILRLGFVRDETNKLLQVEFRVTIRDDNRRVESISEVYQGRTLFTIRHSEAIGRPDPESGWDLAGLKPAIEKDNVGAKSPVQILADMLRPSDTVEEMAKRADYPVYALGRDPSWSDRRQIVDMLDLPSPPHRMFAAVYPAKDTRHVVLVQAHTFNANLGPEAHAGKLIYTSPAGIKVWDDKNGPKMAEILLSSMGSTGLFSGPPAGDRTCYLLETPEGTFPALAINGTLTDAELHGLVDSLVRAKAK